MCETKGLECGRAAGKKRTAKPSCDSCASGKWACKATKGGGTWAAWYKAAADPSAMSEYERRSLEMQEQAFMAQTRMVELSAARNALLARIADALEVSNELQDPADETME